MSEWTYLLKITRPDGTETHCGVVCKDGDMHYVRAAMHGISREVEKDYARACKIERFPRTQCVCELDPPEAHEPGFPCVRS